MLYSSLARDAEREFKKEYPGVPLRHIRTTLICDGYCWRYRDGKWRPEDRNGFTNHSSEFRADGTTVHTEEWTDRKGVKHTETYKTDHNGRPMD